MEANQTAGINFPELKREYISGDIWSVNEFLKSKSIKKNGNISRRTKGWNLDRNTFQEKLNEARDKAIINEEAKATARRVRIARILQMKGLKALEKCEPRTATQATMMLVCGLREEREAMGFNSKTKNGQAVEEPSFLKTRFAQRLFRMTSKEVSEELAKLSKGQLYQ